MHDNEFFMRRALKLALKGYGRTSPNPAVGAVIVKNGKIVGEGYHHMAGLAHAEMEALCEARSRARGAILYVTLEPCNHYGRTPPCSRAIIQSGIKMVVAAMRDPNPVNNGNGINALKRAGIKTVVGVLEKEATRLNEAFVKFITKKTPFITVKVATSLDGKIATRTGDSKWISNPKSRAYVHRLRAGADAIMVGLGTVIKDDPLLTSRVRGAGPREKQPIKIIVDSELSMPVKARIFSGRSPGRVIIATTNSAPGSRIAKFRKIGAEVLVLKKSKGRVDLRQLMRELGARGIANILVEGGGGLIGGLTDAGLVDKFLYFISPKIIGGRAAVTSVEGEGVKKVSQALRLKDIIVRRFGENILIEGVSYVYGNN